MKEKLPSLDGWRAVSISLVLLAHCVYVDGFPQPILRPLNPGMAGSLGVRFFFIVSGFLITWLLISEHEKSGRINLKNFYVRRALRIFPVYFAYLGVLGLLTCYQQSTLAWLGNLTYTTNFIGTPFPTFHLWSLGVEEQFYLVWPVLLICCIRFRKNLVGILLVPLVVAPVVRLCFYKQWYPAPMEWLFQGYSFFAKFDSLAFGCIGSIFFYHQRRWLEALYQRYSVLFSLAGVALIFVPILLQPVHLLARLEVAISDSMQALGFLILLLQSILYPGKGFFRALNWRWVRHLGVLSYSIYIWQQMFCGPTAVVFGSADAWWARFPAWIFTILLAAHASYYLLEKPLFSLREKFRV